MMLARWACSAQINGLLFFTKIMRHSIPDYETLFMSGTLGI